MQNFYRFLPLSLIATLCLVELIGRGFGLGDPPLAILDPDIEYYPKPNSRYSRFGNLVSINRYGMRSRDFNKNSSSGPLYLVLGDSVVYGNHFLDQSQTIATKLELNLRSIADAPIVGALAASSWGPQNIFAHFSKFGPFQGEVAFLIQSSHDRTDVPNWESSEVLPYQLSTPHFATEDIVLALISRLKTQLSDLQPDAHESLLKKQNKSHKSLVALIEALKPNFQKVVLIYHPTRNELAIASESEAYYAEVAEHLGVNYVSHRDLYNKHHPDSIFRDHIHLTFTGSETVANSMYDYIEQSELY